MFIVITNSVGGDPNTRLVDWFCARGQVQPLSLYSQCRDDLLAQVIDGTPSEGYSYSFSFANTVAPNCNIVFGHGACNGNLTEDDCSACLKAALGETNRNCRYGLGAWTKLADCRMKYDNHVFSPNY
ncbi:hypothetical protein MLD38_029712 [Melastoma candidum]|uniref:Uncharacterized protein n=1 Tax=Melastoma candidum TaxID=119954 RepID=A0ACB9N4J8_9MYRT|nr:hypothetical protein MLD38_029712 [Melastoma candidum]